MRIRQRILAAVAALQAVTGIVTTGCESHASLSPDGTPSPNSDAMLDAQHRGGNDVGPLAPTPVTITAIADDVEPYTWVAQNAALVALQDGDGPWQALTGVDGVYRATVTSSRYGVAVGCATSVTGVSLYFQAVSEITDLVVTSCRIPTATIAVPMTVHGFSDKSSEVTVGNYHADFFADIATSFEVPKQTADLLATSFVQQDPGATWSDVVAYRGPTVTVDETFSIDLDLARLALPLESHSIALVDEPIAGTSVVEFELNSEYWTSQFHGEAGLSSEILDPVPPRNAALRYLTIDASMRRPDDVTETDLAEVGTDASGASYVREVDVLTTSAPDVAVALPGLLAAAPPTIDGAGAPHVTLPIEPATAPHAVSFASLTTRLPGALTFRALRIVVRPGWAGGSSTVAIAMPDLSALPGWTDDMQLSLGVPVRWTVSTADREPPPGGTPAADVSIINRRERFGTISAPATTPAALAVAPQRCRQSDCDGTRRFVARALTR